MFGHVEFIKSIIAEINSISVVGKENAMHVLSAINMLEVLKEGIAEENKNRAEAEQLRLDEMRIKRKADLEKALENGETVLGGETIRFDANGNQEVIIS